MRLRVSEGAMSIAQADLLQAYLESRQWAVSATVHERTGCAIIYYKVGERESALESVSRFSYSSPEVTALAP